MLEGKKRSSLRGRCIVISRARYYDPKAGRFISRDPISFAGGDVNLYGYAGNNPINWVDPDGLQTATWPDVIPYVMPLVPALINPVTIGIGIGVGVVLWPEDLSDDDEIHDPCERRDKYQENKPNRKKQGREPSEKKRDKPNWKPRNPPKEPPRHTPSRKD